MGAVQGEAVTDAVGIAAGEGAHRAGRFDPRQILLAQDHIGHLAVAAGRFHVADDAAQIQHLGRMP